MRSLPQRTAFKSKSDHSTLSTQFISSAPLQSKYIRVVSPDLVADQTSFTYDYLEFMSQHPEYQHLKETIKYLYLLYVQMCARGGFIEVVSVSKIDQIIRKIGNSIPTVSKYTTSMVFNNYRQYLFQYEVVCKLNSRISIDILRNFGLCRTIHTEQLQSIMQQSIFKQYETIFREDITLIPNFSELFALKSELASFQSLTSLYANNIVQLNFQPKAISITQEGKLWHSNQKIVSVTLINFANFYSSKSSQKMISALSSLSENQTTTCLKFDPQDQYFEMEVFDSIRNTIFGYRGKHDLLSYCDEDNPGVTLPIFSILAKQSWYGPTQSTTNLSRIYINFGPALLTWYAVPEKDVKKLRKIVHIEYSIDIMKQQGNWWVDLDWVLSKGIPIKKITQQPNSAIIIGAGTLYWYQSNGLTSLASWNLMPKIISQVKSSFDKITINKSISKNMEKVAVKSLFLRYLNHQLRSDNNLPGFNYDEMRKFIQQSLKTWLSDEQKYLNQLIVKCEIGSQKFQYYKLFDNQSYCIDCKQQIMQYFVHNFSHLIPGISCLQCFKNCLLRSEREKKQLKLNSQINTSFHDNRRMLVVYHRYDQFLLNQLMFAKIENNQAINFQKSNLIVQQISQLCAGEYTGQVDQYCSKMNIKNRQKLDGQNNQFITIQNNMQLQEQMKLLDEQDKFQTINIDFIMKHFVETDHQEENTPHQASQKCKNDMGVQTLQTKFGLNSTCYPEQFQDTINNTTVNDYVAKRQVQDLYHDSHRKKGIKYTHNQFKKQQSYQEDQQERTKTTQSSIFRYDIREPKKYSQAMQKTEKIHSNCEIDIFQSNLQFLKKMAKKGIRTSQQYYEISNISERQSDKSDDKNSTKYRNHNKKKQSHFYSIERQRSSSSESQSCNLVSKQKKHITYSGQTPYKRFQNTKTYANFPKRKFANPQTVSFNIHK